jgi:hypothetical protein
VKPVVEVWFMPSVIALLERREARAQEELDAWLQRLREAEEHVASCQERLDCARIGREEVLRALAEEGEGVAGAPQAGAPVSPPASADAQGVGSGRDAVAAASGGPVVPAGYDARPPVWRAGLGVDALSGAYRQIFEVVAARSGPVSARELTAAMGRDAGRLNEVEKVRHRAYALQARGWLARVPGGLFIAAAGPAARGGTRASAGAGGPVSG